MKLVLDDKEQGFLKSVIPNAIQNFENQISKLEVLRTQCAELKDLRTVFENDEKTVELDEKHKSYLMKLLRAHTFERVESLIMKLLK